MYNALKELIHQLVNIYHLNINAIAIIGIQLETKYMGPTNIGSPHICYLSEY